MSLPKELCPFFLLFIKSALLPGMSSVAGSWDEQSRPRDSGAQSFSDFSGVSAALAAAGSGGLRRACGWRRTPGGRRMYASRRLQGPRVWDAQALPAPRRLATRPQWRSGNCYWQEGHFAAGSGVNARRGSRAASPEGSYWAETGGGVRGWGASFPPPRPSPPVGAAEASRVDRPGPRRPRECLQKAPGWRRHPSSALPRPRAGAQHPAPSVRTPFSRGAAPAARVLAPPLARHPTPPLLPALSARPSFAPPLSPRFSTFRYWGRGNDKMLQMFWFKNNSLPIYPVQGRCSSK